MKLQKKILLGVLVTIMSLTTLGTSLLAQGTKDGIGISPTKLVIDGDPGEKLTGQFTVLNSGDEVIKYRVYVNDLNVKNEDYEKIFEPLPGITSPVTWFSVPEGERTLAAGAQEKLDYSITVPFNAAPRGYSAVIFAETAEPEIDTTGIARLKRVGSLVYLTVNGDTTQKGELLSFDTAMWQKHLPIVPSIRIQNAGTTHFEVDGEVRLKNVFGKEVDKASVTGTLLPQTIRNFKPELSPERSVGLYKVEGEVKFLDQTESLKSGWILVAPPLWIALVLAVIAIWIVVIVAWVKRRGKRR